MKIELKNIYHSEQLSEETNAFTANLFVDGVKAGYAKNEGHGGPTYYSAINNRGRDLIQSAEDYCLKLPPKQYPAGEGMEAFSVNMDLENYIDDLLVKYLEQKDLQAFRNKIKRASDKSVIVGIPDHSFRTFTLSSPLSTILLHPKRDEYLVSIIRGSIAPKINEGEKILNTNIPESILKAAGLSENQYVVRAGEEAPNHKQKSEKKNGRKR